MPQRAINRDFNLQGHIYGLASRALADMYVNANRDAGIRRRQKRFGTEILK